MAMQNSNPMIAFDSKVTQATVVTLDIDLATARKDCP
jgi:hypothetical protein